MISTNQLKDLESWGKISNNILKLYNQLKNEELLNGRNTEHYKKLQSYLEMCLEIEKDLENKFYSDEELLENGLVHLNKEGSLSTSRILKRRLKCISDSISRCFQTLKNTYDILSTLSDNELIKSVRNSIERINGCSIELILNIIFLNKYDFYFLELLEKELEQEMDIERKTFLLFSKYKILSCNKALESWYFDFEFNCDSYYVFNDDLTSIVIGLTDKEYKSRLIAMMKKNVKTDISDFLKKDKDDFLDSYDEFEVSLKSLLNMMDLESIKQLFIQFIDL